MATVLFNSDEFESGFSEIKRGPGSNETPLVLNVCVICGSFGSLINIKKLVDDLLTSDDTSDDLLTSDDTSDDRTILVDINMTTGKKEIVIVTPTDKKSAVKIIKKEYPIKPKTIRIRYKPNCKKSKQKKKKGEDAFYNCINIEFVVDSGSELRSGANLRPSVAPELRLGCERSNISAKLFPNGNLQVAGCKNVSVCNRVPQIIFNFINKYGKDSIINPELFSIKEFRIVMLKTSFKFNCGALNLEILKDKINQHNVRTETGEWRNAVYEPGTFPGLNAKHWQPETKEKYIDKIKSGKNFGKKIEGQSTVIVFRQGNASITGAKTVNELSAAYHSIIDIVHKYYDEVVDVDDLSSELRTFFSH